MANDSLAPMATTDGPFWKPAKGTAKKARQKRRKQRQLDVAGADVHTIHDRVFERDEHVCRVCGAPAQSMHELQFRSLRGVPSMQNSLAACGSGTTGCHGLLQTHRVRVCDRDGNETNLDANDMSLRFYCPLNYGRKDRRW